MGSRGPGVLAVEAVFDRDNPNPRRVSEVAAEAAAQGGVSVAEEGVPVREIAAVVGAGLGVPVESLSADEALQHFGWLGPFAAMDLPASSTQTRERLGGGPSGPGLIYDLRRVGVGAADTSRADCASDAHQLVAAFCPTRSSPRRRP